MCGSTCADLDTDSDHCGSCNHGCYGAACSEGACQAELVLTSADSFAMAVGAQHLFFTTISSDVVKRSEKTPGSSATEIFDVSEDLGYDTSVKPIVADANDVFVGTLHGVRRAPIAGPASTQFNPSRSDTMLKMNATYVAFVFDDTVNKLHRVVRINRSGNELPATLHSMPIGVAALSIASDTHWAKLNGNGTATIQHRVGPDAVDVSTAQPELEGLYQIDSRIYWSVRIRGEEDLFVVRSAALDGTGGKDLVTRPFYAKAQHFLADADGLYWVDLTDQGILLMRADLDGKNVREFASTAGKVGLLRTLASDATHLYWLRQPSGQVYRVAK